MKDLLRKIKKAKKAAHLLYIDWFWGGERRERFLTKWLGKQYDNRQRKDWELSDESPHFFPQRFGWFRTGFGNGYGPYSFFRGFHVAQIVQPGDSLLDIGCGDGFFSSRFYSPRCAHIDAIDIEPTAIDAARTFHQASNVNFHLLDATENPFPRTSYDVIVWDSAMGHFSPDAVDAMLEKIKDGLKSNGVFCGSEGLGHEGHDHLMFFETVDDLKKLLLRHFPQVSVSVEEYRINPNFVRKEAYWRCALDGDRIARAQWDTEIKDAS